MSIEDLLNSIQESRAQKVTIYRGFCGDEGDLCMEVIAEHTEGGETRLDLRVNADYSEFHGQSLTAYLSPVDAVLVGERLAASGRHALQEIVAGIAAMKREETPDGNE